MITDERLESELQVLNKRKDEVFDSLRQLVGAISIVEHLINVSKQSVTKEAASEILQQVT